VKVLVSDHAVDVEVVAVGGSVRPREHVLGVEEVEALVSIAPMLKSPTATIA